MKRYFSLLVMLATFYPAYATHIAGAEMSYRYLGNNDYEITLKIYRDCYYGLALYDNPTNVFIYDASGILVETLPIPFTGSDTLVLTANCDSLVPSYECVEFAEFVYEVNLPPSTGGYTAVYQRCCWNAVLENLLNPDENGISVYATIPDPILALDNTSPVFNNEPPFILCTGHPINYDHSAFDSDGDSLTYELCSAKLGGSSTNPYPYPASPPPYADAGYVAPYSSTYPINTSPAIAIDASTGFITGTPVALGRYLLSVCVNEYRNGIQIGIHRREFQVQTIEGFPLGGNNIEDAGDILKIFPQPSDDIVTVAYQNPIECIWFLNQWGEVKKVIQPSMSTSILSIDIHEVSSGVYFLKVLSGAGCLTKQLIISR